MTRTEYTSALRKAGLSVQPAWQAKSDHNTEDGRKDVTCYRVFDEDGVYVTDLILHEVSQGSGVDSFFASPHLRVSDDIDRLKRLAREATQ